MWYEEMFARLEASADPAQGAKMAAYMQNRFVFLGLPRPKLNVLAKPYLREARRGPIDWDFVFRCWDKPYREAQYIAVDYVLSRQKELTDADLRRVSRLITEKSWWETVDSLDAVVGAIVMRYPAQKSTMLQWSTSENLWLRRTAIDFQQRYREKTDAALLSQIIQNNLGSNEFFINKAIGWSLREYSKCDPDWVRRFLAEFGAQMAPLSVKEASRML